MERQEGNQPKVTSVSGGQARPGCAGCRPLEPWLICTGSLVPLSQRADSDQAGSSKTELANPQISGPLLAFCDADLPLTDGYPNNLIDYFFTVILGKPLLSNLGPQCH